MRRFALFLFAACGSHPVDLGDGASDVGIGCDKPQPLLAVTSAIPRLASAAAGSHIVVGWTADDATFGSARISLAGADHIAAVERDALAVAGSYTGVSLALAGDKTLVALGTQDGHSALSLDGAAPVTTTVQLTAPGALVATGDAPAFALAGNDSAAGTSAIVGIASDGTLGTPVSFGSIAARLVATRIKDGLAVAEVLSANTCELVPIDLAITRSGTPIMWGPKQRCTQGVAGYTEATGETLLLRRDTDTASIKGPVVHADRTLAAETTVVASASEPRIAVTTAGTWVTYAESGNAVAALLDATGTPTKTVMLGPISDATAQTVVSTGDTAYALWIGADLELARLCP